VAKLDPLGATQVDRTAIYIDRGGVLTWGGILLTTLWDSDTKELTLGGLDFTHWLQRRFLYTTINAAPAEQLGLVQTIVNYLQSLPGGNIGIQIPAAASAINRNVLYSPWNLKRAYDAIKELSQLYAGFDFAIDVSYDTNLQPQKVLTLSYPRRGASLAQSGWMFDMPGNITKYTWSKDGTNQANQLFATGAGSGPAMLISSASDTAQLATTPLLQDVLSYSAITDQGMLDATVQGALPQRSSSVTIPEFTVRGDKDPIFGSYIIGDDARFKILDEYFNSGISVGGIPIPPGLDTYQRIVGWNITPPDVGTPEIIKLLGGAAG
jgi:hypothetical protein